MDCLDEKITLRVISFVIHTQVYINVGLEIRAGSDK